MGNNKLSGEFNATLDEKGRISLPVSLRKALNVDILIITPNYYENGLWIYTYEEYQKKLDKYDGMTDNLTEEDRAFRRRLYNFHEIEIDKLGRIPINQSYRDFAGLNKDCIFLGVGNYIEIWDTERYRSCIDGSKGTYITASNKLDERSKNAGGGQ